METAFSIHPDYVEKAWNLIHPILLKEGVEACKVHTKKATEKSKRNVHDAKSKKPIVVYDTGTVKNYQLLCQKIEDVLRQHNIPSAGHIAGDRFIKGTRYIEYRHEGDEHYIPAEDLSAITMDRQYNPSGRDDNPFADIHLKPTRKSRIKGSVAITHSRKSDNADLMAVFAKATNEENFEAQKIMSPALGFVYRTVPGKFTQAELELLNIHLQAKNITGTIEESVSRPGNYYLYFTDTSDEAVQAIQENLANNPAGIHAVRKMGNSSSR